MSRGRQRVKPKKVSWSMRLILLILAVALGYEMFSLSRQLNQAKAQSAALQTQISVLAEKNAAIAADIERADDPQMLESLARREQDMVYEGEKVFVDASRKW